MHCGKHLTADAVRTIARCDTCSEYRRRASPDTIMPWHRVRGHAHVMIAIAHALLLPCTQEGGGDGGGKPQGAGEARVVTAICVGANLSCCKANLYAMLWQLCRHL
jgi:hypothetical protein